MTSSQQNPHTILIIDGNEEIHHDFAKIFAAIAAKKLLMLMAVAALMVTPACKGKSAEEKSTEAPPQVRAASDLSGQKITILVTAPQAPAARAAIKWFYQETRGGVEIIETTNIARLLPR